MSGRDRSGARKQVTVLMGGWSAEREVSLVSGLGVAGALAERGYDVTTLDPPRNLAQIAAAFSPGPDVVFNALHGAWGEDGTIQAILDVVGVPYTHSGVLASAVAMNKPLAKRVVGSVGVPSPEGRIVRRSALAAGHPFAPPYVVKPIAEGSSVGITVVRDRDNRLDFAGDSIEDEYLLVEPYVPGRELTVGVMSGPGESSHAIAVTEITYNSAIFDYSVKYSEGNAVHILPAKIPESVYITAMKYARLAHDVIGCAGVTRSDFRWNDAQAGVDGLYFLEINTQPGMTPVSLVPEQARQVGMSYGDLVEWMVESATCRR
jgi:D-alanine-D-alanine ligase